MALIGQFLQVPPRAGQTKFSTAIKQPHSQRTCRCGAALAAAPGNLYLGLDFGTSGARAIAINGKLSVHT